MDFTNINVKEKVNLFHKTIKNLLNYIPQETTTRDDKNPPWVIKDIKELIY